MHDYAMTGCILWWQVLLVLAVAAAVIAVGAAAAARAFRSAVWKRTVWQAAAVALCGLVVLELLGAGEALIRLSGAASTLSGQPTLSGRPTTTPLSRLGRGAGGEGNERAKHEISVAPPLGTAGPIAPAPTAPVTPAPARESPPLLAESPEPPFPLPGIESPWPPAVVESTPLAGPIADEMASLAAPRLSRKRGPVATIPPAAPEPAAPEPEEAAGWPGFVWGIGAAAVLGRAAWTQLLLRRFRRRHGPAGSGPLRRRVDGLARRLGIRRPVCLLEAAGLRAPVAFGLVRPTLVLPASFAGDYGDREQEAILAHELAHLAARDPLWQLVADVLAAALWWHPLVWWLRVRLRAASEAAADEASLLVPGGPDVLAACLVALGRKLVHSRRLGWLSIEGPRFRSGLGRRVERLLSLQAGVRQAPARVRLAIARIAMPLALVTVSVFSTAWARPQATFPEGETTMSVVKHSWQRSLAAIALAAWLGPASPSPAADEKQPAKEPPPPVQATPAHSAEAPADVKPDEPLRGEVRIAVEAKPPVPPTKFDPRTRVVSLRVLELVQTRAKLEAETREIERRLGELRDDQDKEAKELFERLRKVQRDTRKVNEEIERLPPQLRPTIEAPVIIAPLGQPIHFSTPGAAPPAPPGDPALSPPRVEQRRVVVTEPDGQRRDVIEQVRVAVSNAPHLRPEERQQMQKEIRDLERKITDLVKADKAAGEEVHDAVRRMDELRQKLATPAAEAGAWTIATAPPRPPLDPAERERRMKQVHEAAAKLRDAGLPEQADRLIREAEAIFSGHRPMLRHPMMPTTAAPPAGSAMASAAPSSPGSAMMPVAPGTYPPSPPSMPGMGAQPATKPGGPSGPTLAPMYPGMMSPPQPKPPAAAGGFGMMSPPVQPGMPLGGMPPGDAANREIRQQLRELQRQIEELRQQLRSFAEARPARAAERPRHPVRLDELNPSEERPKREARPADDDPFADRPKADAGLERPDPGAKPAKGAPPRR